MKIAAENTEAQRSLIMLIDVSTAQVCDARNDAMKYISRLQKNRK